MLPASGFGADADPPPHPRPLEHWGIAVRSSSDLITAGNSLLAELVSYAATASRGRAQRPPLSLLLLSIKPPGVALTDLQSLVDCQ